MYVRFLNSRRNHFGQMAGSLPAVGRTDDGRPHHGGQAKKSKILRFLVFSLDQLNYWQDCG